MGILDMIARGVSDDIVKGLLAGQGRDRLEQAYRGRAELMALPPAQRPQPRPDRQRLIGQDYANLRPNVPTADPAELYPRGNIGSRLPKGDRGRVLVERGPEIAEALAGRIEASGQLEAPTRMFYHSDGPIYRAAVEAGLSPEDADAFVRDFGQMIAATSPRTNTTQNVQNASSVMAKQAAGIPHRTVIGPGTGGVSEAGYPMMTGEGSLVGQLIDTVVEGGRIDPARNTKPANFASNVSGNRDTATIDTHAVRGILQTLNLIEPGAVPEGYILPPYRSNYSDDPTRLTPDMLDDRPGKQMVDGRSLQTEYPVFADIMHGAAERLGASPAETQSMAWFGLGDQTNLGSDPKTLADLVDERIDVTAQALRLPPEEVARMYFRREIPLYGIAGGLLGAGAASDAELDEYLRSIGAR